MTSLGQRGFELVRSAGKLSVDGVLSFDTAAAAFKAIEAEVEPGDVAELDLTGVTLCDSAGLACVLAIAAQANQRGKSLRVTHMPQGMQALAQVCEVDRLMG